MTIVILALVWVALLLWVLDLTGLTGMTGCKHERLRGVANYYDRDLRAFVHLKECEDCGIALITHER